MLIAKVLLFSTSLLNTKPLPVFADVSIGSQGPYRFLVDTGSQTTLIDTGLAERLGLKPQFRVQIVTQNSSRLLPGLKVDSLRVAETPLHGVEVVFHELSEARRFDPSVAGVLGMNALAQLDFTLSPGRGVLQVGNERPSGAVVPFHSIEDRIAIKARMGNEDLTLILDSGATNIVLFRTPEAMKKSRPLDVTFGTIEGARRSIPTCWTADMSLAADLKFGTQPAAIVERAGTEVDGLIPAALFKTVHVDHTRGEVVLVKGTRSQ